MTRDFNLLQGNDLSDANDANHNQIKLDNQSSSISMLKDILGYSINKQSQIYLEIKAYQNNKNKIKIFNICHKNLSSYIKKLSLENNMKHILKTISRINLNQSQV